ncbi:MAG: transcriptional regulator [Desulfobulbus sp.]|nr:MAG: transcriptional regulator [Desulfobulbus sp.]
MPTVRQQIISLLREQELNPMEISQALHIMEKEVYGHLEHIERSLDRQNLRLAVSPFACLSCGYIFTKRTRRDRPGRCPVCRQGHIRMAGYRIVPA